MGKITEVSGIVLAGGLSTRIGRDKGGLELDRVPLARRSLEALGPIFDELVYVTNNPPSAPAFCRLKITQDEVPHLGPLGGILAGLKASQAQRAFVVGYDMPFVSRALVELLVERDPRADIVVPRSGGRFEPLHAVYSRRCIPIIAAQLAAGDRRIIGFYDKAAVTIVEEPELRAVDPELLSFFNVNTLDDLERAARLAKERL